MPETDGISPLAVAARNLLLTEYSNLLALKHVFENSPDFKLAVEAVAPLHAELVKLEAEREAQKLAEQEKKTALANAVSRAREAALAKVDSDPKVVAARAALAAAK